MSGVNLAQLDSYIIRPVLAAFSAPWQSEAARILLLGTAIHESNAGADLVQEGGGPALGVWQMEPFTHDDCWQNFLNFQPGLAAVVQRFQVPDAGAGQLVYNLAYACAMARVKYIRAAPPLPQPQDFESLADYYKRFYNSTEGAAVVNQALIACFAQAASV